MSEKVLKRDTPGYKALKKAKKDHKTLRSEKDTFKLEQEKTLSQILGSKTPNWNIELTMSKN